MTLVVLGLPCDPKPPCEPGGRDEPTRDDSPGASLRRSMGYFAWPRELPALARNERALGGIASSVEPERRGGAGSSVEPERFRGRGAGRERPSACLLSAGMRGTDGSPAERPAPAVRNGLLMRLRAAADALARDEDATCPSVPLPGWSPARCSGAAARGADPAAIVTPPTSGPCLWLPAGTAGTGVLLGVNFTLSFSFFGAGNVVEDTRGRLASGGRPVPGVAPVNSMSSSSEDRSETTGARLANESGGLGLNIWCKAGGRAAVTGPGRLGSA
jgi:hypothetical protein